MRGIKMRYFRRSLKYRIGVPLINRLYEKFQCDLFITFSKFEVKVEGRPEVLQS